MSGFELDFQPYESCAQTPQQAKDYLPDGKKCVWAAVYRNAAEDSARNRLHSGMQSDVDSKQQRL